MKPIEIPVTPAIRQLRAAGIVFKPHFYTYIDRGGTRHAADSLAVPEHEVIKTLVMEAQEGTGNRKTVFLMLMHGDREVSTKQLAREMNVKTVQPASESAVEKATGYIPGGVSPFGARQKLAVYAEASVMSLERIFLNGGKRGFLVEIAPADLRKLLQIQEVNVALEL